MKKQLTASMLVLLMVFGMTTACGKKSENTDTAVTSDAGETLTDTQSTPVQETEPENQPVADDTSRTDDVTLQEEENKETVTTVKEYTMKFYQYGEYLDTVGLQMTDTEFRLINQETEETEEVYSYTVLSDSLIALYVEDAQAYTICYYKISGFDYTLNILGATAAALVGTYQVYYVDQGATATIEFSIDGTAVESNQISADGNEMNSPYEFRYCWYAADDTNMFMFVCLDNGYYAYTVEMAEDGTLNLTENGAYTYDL